MKLALRAGDLLDALELNAGARQQHTPSRMSGLRCVLVVAFGLGCSGLTRTTPSRTDRPAISAEAMDSAVARLAVLPGEFRDRDGGFYFEFTGDNDRLDELSRLDTLVVPQLVECLGSPVVGQATFNGVRQPVAVLCALVLSGTPFLERLRRRDDWSEECEDAIWLDYHDATATAVARTYAAWQAILAATRANTLLHCVV